MSVPEPAPVGMRRGSHRTVVAGALAVVALLAAVLAAVVLARPDAPGPASTGGAAAPGLGSPVPLDQRVAPDARAPLPDRTLEGFGDGPPVALGDYRGRPLVVNFWATWCDPCVREMPALNEVAGDLEDEVAFLGVDVMDAPSRAGPFVEDLGVVYDLAADPDAALFREVGGYGMPTTLLVDADGTIVHRVTGELRAAALRDLLGTELGVAAGG